ncbi:hypothetical protein NKH77_41585 [Streptomyces sp. M19]
MSWASSLSSPPLRRDTSRPRRPGEVVRPGQSIQEAVDRAAPGETVMVRPGTYRESVWITTRG